MKSREAEAAREHGLREQTRARNAERQPAALEDNKERLSMKETTQCMKNFGMALAEIHKAMVPTYAPVVTFQHQMFQQQQLQMQLMQQFMQQPLLLQQPHLLQQPYLLQQPPIHFSGGLPSPSRNASFFASPVPLPSPVPFSSAFACPAPVDYSGGRSSPSRHASSFASPVSLPSAFSPARVFSDGLASRSSYASSCDSPDSHSSPLPFSCPFPSPSFYSPVPVDHSPRQAVAAWTSDDVAEHLASKKWYELAGWFFKHNFTGSDLLTVTNQALAEAGFGLQTIADFRQWVSQL